MIACSLLSLRPFFTDWTVCLSVCVTGGGAPRKTLQTPFKPWVQSTAVGGRDYRECCVHLHIACEPRATRLPSTTTAVPNSFSDLDHSSHPHCRWQDGAPCPTITTSRLPALTHRPSPAAPPRAHEPSPSSLHPFATSPTAASEGHAPCVCRASHQRQLRRMVAACSSRVGRPESFAPRAHKSWRARWPCRRVVSVVFSTSTLRPPAHASQTGATHERAWGGGDSRPRQREPAKRRHECVCGHYNTLPAAGREWSPAALTFKSSLGIRVGVPSGSFREPCGWWHGPQAVGSFASRASLACATPRADSPRAHICRRCRVTTGRRETRPWRRRAVSTRAAAGTGGTGGSYISSSDLHEDIIAMYERRVEALVRTPHCHCVHTISRGESRE